MIYQFKHFSQKYVINERKTHEFTKNGSLYQLPALYNVLHLRNANEYMTLKTNVHIMVAPQVCGVMLIEPNSTFKET